MLKLSRNFLLAGVLSLGLAACGDDVTVTEPPPPPPPTETPNITTFTVSPPSATIAPGTFVQASVTLITKPGVTGTVTWVSSNPAVATVDANGRIDAVAEGTSVVTATATAGGQSANAQVGITVRPIQPAQVSIKSVTQGLTTLPVNISNVFGQIEITLNFDPGEQIVDSVAVFIGNVRAAKQAYVTSPSAGDIVLSVNTANFHEDYATGTAPVDYLNGATTISAAVYPRAGAATATNTIQIVLNNADGWSADMTAPTRVANRVGTGLTYWGGPGADGITEVTVYPVIYTPGRSVSSVFVGIGGCSTGTALTALPFRATFGYGADSADVDCSDDGAGYEWTGGARNNATAFGAIDNTNNSFPSTPTIANTVVLNSTPDSLRFDWSAPGVNSPSLAAQNPAAVPGWVNAAFEFGISGSDAGVGLAASGLVDPLAFYNEANCGAGNTDIAMATATGDDIPECATNAIGGAPAVTNGTGPYTVYATGEDLLTNLGTSNETSTFGVDKTLPSIRWGLASAAPAVDSAVAADTVFALTKPSLSTKSSWRVEFLDLGVAPSGFAPGAQASAFSTAGHVNNAGLCLTASTTPIGASFVTAPECDLVTYTGTYTVRTDGWSFGDSLPVPDPEGYYGYASNVTDAAGNASETLFRAALVNTESPFASLLGAVSGILGATNMAFTPTFADSAEIAGYSLEMEYPNFAGIGAAGTLDLLRYPQTILGTPLDTTGAVVFDNVINSPFSGNITPATGAPYVRHVEAVTAAVFPNLNVAVSPISNAKPTSAAAWSWNWGSIVTTGATPTPGSTGAVSLPALLVEDGVPMDTFNLNNPTTEITHWRVIPDATTANQFGSEVPLRAQLASSSNNPNPAFVRVDFYRWDGAAAWNYLGSATTAVFSDQGTYRSYVWSLDDASFVKDWTGADQAALASADVIAAVGVTAAGDGIVAGVTMP